MQIFLELVGSLKPWTLAFFSFFPPLSSAPPCRSNCSLICFSWPNSLGWQPAIWIHDMLHKSVHIVGTRMCMCECVPIFMGLMDVWSLELWTLALFPFFFITVISTTMSFKVSVNVLLLAGNLHSRHVADISLYCRHKNVFTKRHLTCDCVLFFSGIVLPIYNLKNVYPTFESWTLNPEPQTLDFEPWFPFFWNPGFPTAVISTMSFKVFVDVFLLAKAITAGKMHCWHHVALISLYCQHRNVWINFHFLICEYVTNFLVLMNGWSLVTCLRLQFLLLVSNLGRVYFLMGSTWNDAMFSLLHICISLIGHPASEVGGFQSGRLCSLRVLVKQTLSTQSCSKNVLSS